MERWLSWSKAHDWKSCVDLNSTGGSNPPLSARKRHPIGCLFCFIRNCLHRGVDSFFIKVQQNGFGFFVTSIQIPATLIEKSENGRRGNMPGPGRPGGPMRGPGRGPGFGPGRPGFGPGRPMGMGFRRPPPPPPRRMVGPYRGGCLPGCLFYVLGTAGIFAALLAVLL